MNKLQAEQWRLAASFQVTCLPHLGCTTEFANKRWVTEGDLQPQHQLSGFGLAESWCIRCIILVDLLAQRVVSGRQ